METDEKILLHLLKDVSKQMTITGLAQQMDISRVGAWKSLRKLETQRYIELIPLGAGKTSAMMPKINWQSELTPKALSLYLAKEAMPYERWRNDFKKVEDHAEFLVLFGSMLHSPKEARDVDVLVVAKKGNIAVISRLFHDIQKMQAKKIHYLTFTEQEFRNELHKPNKAFIDAIKKGAVLSGEDRFIRFMRRL